MDFKLVNSNNGSLVTTKLLAIAKGMNTGRSDFSNTPSNPTICPYYLLGFIEGDGCFSCKFNQYAQGSFSLRRYVLETDTQKITNR
jgi:hypothetical protein